MVQTMSNTTLHGRRSEPRPRVRPRGPGRRPAARAGQRPRPRRSRRRGGPDRAGRRDRGRATGEGRGRRGRRRARRCWRRRRRWPPTRPWSARPNSWSRDRGLPAPRAVFEAAGTFADMLAAAGGYLAERVRDIHDVADRLVAELTGVAPPGVPELAGPSVLVARDLAPADTAGLDPAKVLALVTEEGGPTSHTAILARSLRHPGRGRLPRHPGPAARRAGRGRRHRRGRGRRSGRHASRPPWPTGPDRLGRRRHHRRRLPGQGAGQRRQPRGRQGRRGAPAPRASACSAPSSATCRRPTEPTEAEQRAAYAAVLTPFAGKPVVVRTLDAGADKPLGLPGSRPRAQPGARRARPAGGHAGPRRPDRPAAGRDRGCRGRTAAPRCR